MRPALSLLREAFLFGALLLITGPAFGITPSENRSEQADRRIEFTVAQAQNLVTLLYRGILFREPEEEGLNHHTIRLLRDGYEGLLVTAAHMGGSDEFINRVAVAHSPTEIVENMYRVFFNRQLEPNTPWPTLLVKGKSSYVAYRIVRSDEFFLKNIQPLLP